jgi:hypothetical protein
MKVRNGFVSNSSSSSFLVNINDITCIQRHKLNENKILNKNFCLLDCYPVIFGYTCMDNLGIKKFLSDEGFDIDKFQFWSSNDRDILETTRDISMENCSLLYEGSCNYCQQEEF